MIRTHCASDFNRHNAHSGLLDYPLLHQNGVIGVSGSGERYGVAARS